MLKFLGKIFIAIWFILGVLLPAYIMLGLMFKQGKRTHPELFSLLAWTPLLAVALTILFYVWASRQGAQSFKEASIFTLLKTFAMISAGLMMALIAFIPAIQSAMDSLHYRMTVSVETPEGIKTGSAVRATDWSRSYDYMGEAVAVDLGHRGILLERPNGNYGITDAIEDVFPIHENPKTGTKVVLEPAQYPSFITFRDINDPMSQTDVHEMDEAFGAGVRIREISIEVTREGVTSDLVKSLPWLPCPQQTGQRSSGKGKGFEFHLSGERIEFLSNLRFRGIENWDKPRQESANCTWFWEKQAGYEQQELRKLIDNAAGNAEIQRRIAEKYYGNGVPRDMTKAKKWLESAAALGDQKAYASLTGIFDREYHAPTEMRDFYLRLGQAGIRDAQRALGALYNKGYPGSPGISVDYPEAYFWLLLANGGDKTGNSKIIDQIDIALTEEEKKSVEKRAAEWHPTALTESKSEGK